MLHIFKKANKNSPKREKKNTKFIHNNFTIRFLNMYLMCILLAGTNFFFFFFFCTEDEVFIKCIDVYTDVVGNDASLSFGRFQLNSQTKYTKTRPKLTPDKVHLLYNIFHFSSLLPVFRGLTTIYKIKRPFSFIDAAIRVCIFLYDCVQEHISLLFTLSLSFSLSLSLFITCMRIRDVAFTLSVGQTWKFIPKPYLIKYETCLCNQALSFK